jgi:hypothetical protein
MDFGSGYRGNQRGAPPPISRPSSRVRHRAKRACVPFIPLGTKVLLSVPDMLLFLAGPAGYMVLAALLQSAMAMPDDPHTAVPYGDIGYRFGVLRTHVRNLLTAAEEAELVELRARSGHRVEILPRLWASHDRGIAGGTYLHDIDLSCDDEGLSQWQCACGGDCLGQPAPILSRWAAAAAEKRFKAARGNRPFQTLPRTRGRGVPRAPDLCPARPLTPALSPQAGRGVRSPVLSQKGCAM